MNEEKMLIKIEDLSIFRKICNFIKRLFFRKKRIAIEEIENSLITENTEEVIEEKEIETIEENEMTEEKVETIVEENALSGILYIQKQYEEGKIKEEDLTEEEIKQLTELYKSQIKEIEEDIDLCVDKIEYYRAKVDEAYNY